MSEYNGLVVCSNLLSLRFSESGKLRFINCRPSQIVRRGDTLATLDPKPIQVMIDIELADFRRIRSEFDQLTRQIPVAKSEDDKTKKEIAQSKLDVSVKNVEKYKNILDGYTLVSPCDGIVDSTEGLLSGVNITPGSYPITLIPLDSAVFEMTISEDDFYKLSPNQAGKIVLKNGFTFESKIIYLSPVAAKNGEFSAHLQLPNIDLNNYRIGTTGKVFF